MRVIASLVGKLDTDSYDVASSFFFFFWVKIVMMLLERLLHQIKLLTMTTWTGDLGSFEL